MTGREFLHNVWTAPICLKEIMAENKRVQSDIENLRAVDYSAPRVSGGNQQHGTEDAVARLEAVRNRLRDEAMYWTAISDQCTAIISTMSCGRNTETYRRLLRFHYVCHMRWEGVAMEMNFSYRRVIQLHGEALAEFDKAFAAYVSAGNTIIARKNNATCRARDAEDRRGL